MDFLIIVYLIVYLIYLYNRFKEFGKDLLTNPKRTQHVGKYIRYTPSIMFCCTLVIIVVLFCFGNSLSIIFGLLIFLIGLFYSLFFKKVTQEIIGFKSFYVSFAYALLVIFLIFYYSSYLNLSVIFVFIFVFLRVLVNTIFFDIKDIESDKKDKLKTIPVFFGKKRTLILLHIINIISFISIVTGVYVGALSFFSLSLIFFYFYSLYYLQEVKNNKINIQNLSYVIVDGEYLFWPFILFLAKFIML